MVEYDPSVIRRQAERLYQQASQVQIIRALLWAALSGALTYVGMVLARANLHASYGWDPGSVAAGMAVLFGIAGYAVASDEAFRLRLQAQVALCQVQIEANTAMGRPSEAASVSEAGVP